VNDPKPDAATVAHAELDRLLAAARQERATGSVVVEVHMNAGTPGAVKATATRVVK
jgi:hypothetical protein